MSILSCGRIYIDIQRLSEFAFFSTNKSDKKDKLSHQSLNITSSSNAIVKILCHTHTFRHAGSYKKRIALTFVKPRGGEGQNGRLKCPIGFLVIIKSSLKGQSSHRIVNEKVLCPMLASSLQPTDFCLQSMAVVCNMYLRSRLLSLQSIVILYSLWFAACSLRS